MIDTDFQRTKVVVTKGENELKSWSDCSDSSHHSTSCCHIEPFINFPNIVTTIQTVLKNLTTLSLYRCEIHWLDLVRLSKSRAWESGVLDHIEFCYSYFILRNYFNIDSLQKLMKSRQKGIRHLVFISNNEMGTYTVYQGQTQLFFQKLVEESRTDIEELICDNYPDLDPFISSLQCLKLRKIEKYSPSGVITSVTAEYSAGGNELEQVQIV